MFRWHLLQEVVAVVLGLVVEMGAPLLHGQRTPFMAERKLNARSVPAALQERVV